MDGFNAIDYGANYFFGFYRGENQFLMPVMRFGAWLGSLEAVAIVIALAVIVTPAGFRRRAAVVLMVSALLGGALVELVKEGTHRMSPTDSQFAGTQSFSFPSRAVFLATFAWFMLAVAVARRATRRRHIVGIYGLAALAIVFVCVSQLWLSLHFVTDIIAGLTGGLGLALIAKLQSTSGDLR